MVAFDGLEDLFQQIRESSDYSRAAVTLTTSIGALFVTYVTFKAIYHSVIAFRLYVSSQYCCKGNYLQKYGKWAVVTGSTDGIGLAMAKELAQRGHSIILVGRNDEKLNNCKAQIAQLHEDIEVVTVRIDLSDTSIENYRQIVSIIDPENRDIGILVNNAGTFPPELKRFHKVSEDNFRTIVNVNCIALLYFTRMILPGMIQRGRGLILNVSSSAAFLPGPYMNVYGPTKKFVNGFSENLQMEYKNHPIDIINLTPGAVQTKLFHGVYDTTSLSKPNLLAPSPEDYARTAINGISTGHHMYCGSIGHALTLLWVPLLDFFGMTEFVLRSGFKMNSSKFELSPVPKRKNRADPSTRAGLAGGDESASSPFTSSSVQN